MNDIILSQFTLDELIEKMRPIFREEIKAELSGQNSDKLLSPAEALAFFSPKISITTLRSWTDAGIIPMQKIRGRNFYKKSDLLEAGTKNKKYKRI